MTGLASMYVDLSHSLAKEGKAEESLTALRECCQRLENRLAQSTSARQGHELIRELALANNNLLVRLSNTGQGTHDETERLSRRNHNICEKALLLYAKDGDLHYFDALACNNLVAALEKKENL